MKLIRKFLKWLAGRSAWSLVNWHHKQFWECLHRGAHKEADYHQRKIKSIIDSLK